MQLHARQAYPLKVYSCHGFQVWPSQLHCCHLHQVTELALKVGVCPSLVAACDLAPFQGPTLSHP